MKETPKSLRLQIGIFGRTNVGKSSFLNMVAGQDVAITSSVAGTTTDVVEKTMELLPIGPVVLLDTAGIDDISELSSHRLKKTKKIFDRADIACLLTEPDKWDEYEENILQEAKKRNIPAVVIVNKIDAVTPSETFINNIKKKNKDFMLISCINREKRDNFIDTFKKILLRICPEDFLSPPPLIGDLLPSGGVAVMVIPIDIEAPKGRLILPQVQAMRDILDNDSAALIVKEREYANILQRLKRKPDIVVCDSQVVLKMVADTPDDVKCTTFSILFARYKGDLIEAVKGACIMEKLHHNDKILIAEACSHHALEDDIGRVKIPRWIRQYIGGDIKIDVYSGRDYPDNLSEYKLVVHCGGCMLTRREMLYRIHKAKQAGVSITNYGVCISYVQGVLKRVLSPFPAAKEIFITQSNK